VNCNSTKKDKDVVLSDVLLPDRDNTFLAYLYAEAAAVQVSPLLSRRHGSQRQTRGMSFSPCVQVILCWWKLCFALLSPLAFSVSGWKCFVTIPPCAAA
jgi:hypothetical protein